MILISQKAEHNFVGVNCGIMDQYASMFGRVKSALFLDCRSINSTTFKLNLKILKLVLVNTNVKHDLSESAYNERRTVCEKVANLLNLKALRDASQSKLKSIRNQISETDFNKALYVIQENERVKKFATSITQNEYERLGKLMYESHEGLSKNYKVSCEELDFLVEITKSMDFVYGSRMMGGGFGGCTINLVERSNIDNFKTTTEKKFLKKFKRQCSIYDVNISKGTHLIKY